MRSARGHVRARVVDGLLRVDSGCEPLRRFRRGPAAIVRARVDAAGFFLRFCDILTAPADAFTDSGRRESICSSALTRQRKVRALSRGSSEI